jgi:hypothetical protein
LILNAFGGGGHKDIAAVAKGCPPCLYAGVCADSGRKGRKNMNPTKYLIKPLEGFKDLSFGDSREKTRALFGSFSEFRKTKFSKNTTDDFGGFHVYYNADDKVEAVEFFNGEVNLGETILFPATKKYLADTLKKLETSTNLVDDTVVSSPLGISAYAPSDTVEAILIHSKSYFD